MTDDHQMDRAKEWRSAIHLDLESLFLFHQSLAAEEWGNYMHHDVRFARFIQISFSLPFVFATSKQRSLLSCDHRHIEVNKVEVARRIVLLSSSDLAMIFWEASLTKTQERSALIVSLLTVNSSRHQNFLVHNFLVPQKTYVHSKKWRRLPLVFMAELLRARITLTTDSKFVSMKHIALELIKQMYFGRLINTINGL